ncbi:MAG: ATPase domain-containing protein [Candidatus Aenigmarchaeota archaeon]
MAEGERLKSGVIDLDEKIEGGFVNNSVILLRGKAGTGKTAFCSSFLYAGAMNKEPGLYVTTEQGGADIKMDIKKMFGWDLESLEKKGLLKIISITPIATGDEEKTDRLIKAYISEFTNKIGEAIKSMKAQRVVIDSVSILEMFIQNRYISRVTLMSLTRMLKRIGVTTMFTEGIAEHGGLLGEEALTEFVVDTVITLEFTPITERYNRTMLISKMRRTDHSTFIHPFQISKRGLELLKIKTPTIKLGAGP